MVNMKKTLLLIFVFLSFLIIPNSVSATIFDLIEPTGQLVRGQDVVFTINIDTEGESLSPSSVGMTYETQYLEYVSAAPGDTFTTVSADVQSDGKLIITGSGDPYSGAGTFAYVTFKLIATESGSTRLCVLFDITSATPTPGPTSTPGPGEPTSPPAPTALPKTGESNSTVQGAILASLFFVAAGVGLFVFKKT
ncbi:hypothetical protein COV87_03410 [Candidatus Roizmanbacteria bacterium CG11_big_fil_rev_8_21_14_0_20_37_16]|uniref:Gram-positive cocci surface proteins LPxTG domain-containing protein n=1 Tax=Candidatus Roizmanbacteria bacterium CG11_big_fil_rev_8_21_14_0_20_37_16 TaxID=1974857 RepID=A0A2H0KJL0_9BACT|nr:MAG: hypothetical protein COV87_03410 [Candidatus Roizmanbacteria bacterium CG11_big_fil_rev_8_21_14_0_20_37_16]